MRHGAALVFDLLIGCGATARGEVGRCRGRPVRVSQLIGVTRIPPRTHNTCSYRVENSAPDERRRHVMQTGGDTAVAASPGPPGQRKRTFNVARPKIFRPADFAPTTTTPVRVSGSSDLIRPLNSMSAPSVADTIAGEDSRIAYRVTAPGSPVHAEANPAPNPMVSIPWAITSGSPASLALSSSRWIGLESPATPE